MGPQRFHVFLASLWYSNAEAGGVSIGGTLPKGIIATKMTTAQRLALRGQIKAVRWVSQDGRSVFRHVDLALGAALTLDAPAGEWSDVVLVFAGDVLVRDGSRSRTLPIRSLEIPLDEPLLTEGGSVLLDLVFLPPEGLWTDAAPLLDDGAVGYVTLAP